MFLDLFEEKLMGFDIYGLWVKNRKKREVFVALYLVYTLYIVLLSSTTSFSYDLFKARILQTKTKFTRGRKGIFLLYI